MACANHPEQLDGLKNCSRCGRTFCGDCLVELQGAPVCAGCKEEVVKDVRSGVESQVTGDKQPSPWDRRKEIGILRAVKETTVGVMFRPGRFFASIHPTGDHGPTLGYGFMIGTLWSLVGGLVGFAVNMAIMGGFGQFGGAGGPFGPNAAEFGFGMGWVVGLFLLLMPVFVLVFLYLGTALIHLGLLVVRSGKSGFEATFRVFCYSYSVAVLGLVPILGGYIYPVWMIVSTIWGVKEVHRTTGLKAAFSVLIWIFLCCGCYAAIFALAFGAVRYSEPTVVPTP